MSEKRSQDRLCDQAGDEDRDGESQYSIQPENNEFYIKKKPRSDAPNSDMNIPRKLFDFLGIFLVTFTLWIC